MVAEFDVKAAECNIESLKKCTHVGLEVTELNISGVAHQRNL
jgi:hypothetical protein